MLGYSSDNKIGRLQIVPWFNKEEWKETYQQVYSDKTEMQEKAYTQMCIWKARYPNLPLGVECTMSMLHVRLCDKQSDNSVTLYKDRDLQLLYSTAVMRFLNHVTVMSNVKDSMYKMAERHSIPDWLINLRHEAAHGNTLPALYLLRQAGNIIMQWLQEHYWQTEAAVMEDVIVDSRQQREEELEKVRELLRLWLQLKTLHWAGLKTIDNIPDEQIRERAMKLAKEEGVGIKLPDTESKQSGNMTINDNERERVLEGNNSQDVYTHKIKTAFEPLVRKLMDPLKSKMYKRALYQSCLIESLVRFEGFCPNIRVEEIDELATLELMSLLGELWKELLASLQMHGLLAQLMTVLSQSGVSSAQVWLRLFCQLLAGQSPLHPPGSLSVCRLLADRLPCNVHPQVLFRKVNLHHVRHQSPLHLKPPSAEEVGVLQDLVHSVLYDPSPFTARYLDCLLQYHSTPLSTDSRQCLCALAQVYTGHGQTSRSGRLGPRPSTVHTLASLLDLGLDVTTHLPSPPDSHMADAPPDTDSHWTLYSGDADWGRSALGTLPW